MDNFQLFLESSHLPGFLEHLLNNPDDRDSWIILADYLENRAAPLTNYIRISLKDRAEVLGYQVSKSYNTLLHWLGEQRVRPKYTGDDYDYAIWGPPLKGTEPALYYIVGNEVWMLSGRPRQLKPVPFEQIPFAVICGILTKLYRAADLMGEHHIINLRLTITSLSALVANSRRARNINQFMMNHSRELLMLAKRLEFFNSKTQNEKIPTDIADCASYLLLTRTHGFYFFHMIDYLWSHMLPNGRELASLEKTCKELKARREK